MYEMLRAKNDGLRRDVIEFTKKLIKEPSESLKEENVATLIENEMKSNDYDEVFKDKAGNVIGMILGRENDTNILLISHMDTIGVKDINEWTKDPYGAEIEDNRIFGRGASDCKAGIASQVYAGVLLKRSMLPLKGNLIVASTVAEKNGLSIGTRFLMNETLPQMKIKPDIVILGEPTDNNLYYGHDGWAEIKLNIEAENSFNVVDATDAIKQDLFAGEEKNFEYEVSEPVFVNNENGCRAEMILRTRIKEGDNIDAIVNRTERMASLAVKPVGKVALSAFVRNENEMLYTGHVMMTKYITHAWAINPYHPMIERARQSLEAGGLKVFIDKWKLGMLEMGTAGSVLTKEFNIPAIGYGPGTVEAAHGVDEYVKIENIFQAIYGTTLITHGIIGIPVCGWTLDEI